MVYAVCSVLMVPALAQVTAAKSGKGLFSASTLFFLGFEAVYILVFGVLMVAYLIWYCALIDWARGRGIAVPGKFAAVAFWFIALINFVHPYLTLRRIQRESNVKTPLMLWWVLLWASLILSTLGTSGMARGSIDPVLAFATALEVVAVLLCWRIVRDFRRADQAWRPREALMRRG